MAAPQTTSFPAMLGRVTWMFFGPMLLVLTAVALATGGTRSVSFTDLVYFLVLGAILAGRWVEFRWGDPQTAAGEPATPQMLLRYTVMMSLVGVAVWGAATAFRAIALSG